MTIISRPEPTPEERERAVKAYGRLLRDLDAEQQVFWWREALGIASQAAKVLFWVLVCGCLTWLAFMALDRSEPIADNRREMLSDYVHRGEGVMTKRTRRRVKQCDVTTQEVIIDSENQRFEFDPTPPVVFSSADPQEDVRGPKVPRGAAEGEAYTFSVLRFYCNPLQRAMNWPIVFVTPRTTFTILPDGAPFPPTFVPPRSQLDGGTNKGRVTGPRGAE